MLRVRARVRSLCAQIQRRRLLCMGFCLMADMLRSVVLVRLRLLKVVQRECLMPQGYTLAYRHHYKSGMVQGTAMSFGSVHSTLFSVLGELSLLREAEFYDFMMQWHGPHVCARHCQGAPHSARQRWKQNSDPLTSKSVEGYVAVDTPFTLKGLHRSHLRTRSRLTVTGWGGLHKCGAWEAEVCGGAGDWGYALLQHEPFAGRLHGPPTLPVDMVELWVR